MMNQLNQKGFTILEVLVASIIMMVSLLGLGALQSTSMQKNISAMNKTHAMNSMNYIGDALRSQLAKNQAVSGNFEDFTADYWNTSNYQSNYVSSCGTGCDRDTMTKHMLAEWERMIGVNLPSGQGSIVQQDRFVDIDGSLINSVYYEITVMWDDRQMAQNEDGSYGSLGLGCSGNPTVDLTCLKTFVYP